MIAEERGSSLQTVDEWGIFRITEEEMSVMLAMKAKFDGKQVRLPSVPPVHECPVIVVFNEDIDSTENEALMKAQEYSLKKVWANEEDAAYDDL